MAGANDWSVGTVRELALNSVLASFAGEDLQGEVLRDIDTWGAKDPSGGLDLRSQRTHYDGVHLTRRVR